MEGPVLVHVITKKGKGYSFAENDPARFHGIAPFRIETGETTEGNEGIISYTKMFGNAIVKLARENPDRSDNGGHVGRYGA